MVGTIAKLKSYTNEIYANPDHVHILCNLPRTITIADFISKVKSSSSKWMKDNGVPNFAWQDGYGVFSVSSSKVEVVSKYIENQEEHHKKVSFKDEMREFFRKYGIDYDERYVWD
jgi:REP element-mobilizing transposase RayT